MLGEIIVGILGASGIIGAILKYKKALRIVKEVSEVVSVSIAALEDGKLSLQESEKVWKELQDVIKIVAPVPAKK